MPVSTRRSAARATMNQYTNLFSTSEAAFAKPAQGFDEASHADLTAFFDLSSFTTAEHAPLVIPEQGTGAAQPASFTNAFGGLEAPGSAGALRPVDDSLLDSPLDLELSPASFTSASSISGSPFDFGSAVDYTSPLLSSYGSPLVDSIGAQALADMPSLFAPAPSSLGFEISTAPQWNPQDVVMSAAAAAAQVPAAQVFAPVSSPMEDVKPVLPRLDSTGSLLFDFDLPAVPAITPAPAAIEVAPVAAPEPTPAPAPTSAGKRKTVAQLKKEAALLVEDKAFKPDNFKGFRNTKKPMISYDAPTLPKNYLTESATSRKRAAAAEAKASTPAPANKRARSSSAVPQVELPQTQAEPIAADDLDEEQLSAIELKRRMNTLAARRSRMRKAEFLKSLQDEIDRLKMLNEDLQRENARLKEKCGE
ncbi:hypothetical protein JCM8097_003253 [Rhodosporidiobolus ruineniae]